jgi:hypothetical protein
MFDVRHAHVSIQVLLLARGTIREESSRVAEISQEYDTYYWPFVSEEDKECIMESAGLGGERRKELTKGCA